VGSDDGEWESGGDCYIGGTNIYITSDWCREIGYNDVERKKKKTTGNGAQ